MSKDKVPTRSSLSIPPEIYGRLRDEAERLGYSANQLTASFVSAMLDMIEDEEPSVPWIVHVAKEKREFDQKASPKLKAADAALTGKRQEAKYEQVKPNLKSAKLNEEPGK